MDAVTAQATTSSAAQTAVGGRWRDAGSDFHPVAEAGVLRSQSAAFVNEVIVEVLRGLLDTAEREGLELNAIDGDRAVGLIVECAGLRLALLVDAACESRGLSPREMQIARMVADGATNRAIGSTLEISLWTVSTHLRRVFAKLGVNSRAEMVAQLFGTPHLPPPAKL